MLINEGQIEATRENTWILQYHNDMLNGVIIDLDDNYAFIPEAQDPEDYVHIQAQLAAEGVETVIVEPDVDMTQPPHCWVVQSMARCVIKGAEELLD